MKTKPTPKQLGDAFRAGMAYALYGPTAMDASRWITVHPHGKDNAGSPVLIDGSTGEVLGGMGSKFNGKHISAVAQGGKNEEHGAQAVIDRVHAKKTAKTSLERKTEIRAFAERPEVKGTIERLLKAHTAKEIVAMSETLGGNVEFGTSASLAAAELVRSVGVDKIKHVLDDEEARASRAKKAAETRRKNTAERAAKALEAAVQAVQTVDIPSNYGRVEEPIKIKKSTEKAVQIDGPYGFTVWLPKSQIKIHDGKYVIAMADWVAKQRDIPLSMSADHESNLRAYKQRIADERREKARSSAEAYYKAREEGLERYIQAEKEHLREKGMIKTKVPSHFALVGERIKIYDKLYEVAEVHADTRISEDDPSMLGNHLNGYELDPAKWVYLKPVSK